MTFQRKKEETVIVPRASFKAARHLLCLPQIGWNTPLPVVPATINYRLNTHWII